MNTDGGADMAWDDPIVAETRALREQLMEEVGNDLEALVKYLQERELEHPERLVSLPPRRANADPASEEENQTLSRAKHLRTSA
jgi:hypothetical protein